jgi:hypothetical protein
MDSSAEMSRSMIRSKWPRLAGVIGTMIGVMIEAISPASAAGPAMSTTWVPTALDESACVQRAEHLVRDAGLSRNLKVIGPTVFGQIASYTASVRCIPDKGIVMFVVAGPDLEAARRHLRQISDKF